MKNKSIRSATCSVENSTRSVAWWTLLLVTVLTSQVRATPIPQNLGNGLRAIVEKQLAPSQAAPGSPNAPQQRAVSDYERLKITDAQNRMLVNIMLNGSVPLQTLQGRITAAGANVTAIEGRYRAGVIEAFVSAAQAVEIAKMEGVSAVHLVPKPVNNIGKATTQGIVQHRIDKLPSGIDGTGVTIGVLSDSYDTHGGPVMARNDIASGDLPGGANPFGHTQSVVIFQDGPYAGDEGRAMLQIVHDIAPNARLGFATADIGEVSFANNIRSLAGLPTGPLSKPYFKADVIIDDVIYFDEPMFQDGIVAQAVDEVAGAGVSYFSSAGNQPASQAYDSPLRIVPATAEAIAGANLNFTGVDPALYKGGFHNFASDGTPKIAQHVHVDQYGIIVFQWNEPFDSTPPTLGKFLQSGSGTLTTKMLTKTFPFSGTAGQEIAIIADSDLHSQNPLPDITITLIDPHGNEIAFQDATSAPETLISFLPVTGIYKIVIGSYFATGDFVYKVRQASGTAYVHSDFNLLFFDPTGNFFGAVAENNRATNRPIEIAELPFTGDVTMVIARANKPPQGIPVANHIRYTSFFGVQPQDFVNYNTPATYGHSCALGASGVAAYPFYPPYIPESFTSPGPVTIYFDKDNNSLPQPERRQKPDMAAMDGANTTFFVEDVTQDSDTLPNFFGTSAAAPHAGGIAALMLQAAGGPHSLSPDSVRQTLEASAFLHDLDPNRAQASTVRWRDAIVVSARGDGTNTSSTDPNFFGVTYSGVNSLTSLTLNLSNADPTERPTPGLVFDPNAATGLPFTLGSLYGVPASAITTAFTVPAAPPAAPNQYRRLTLSIKPGAMNGGDIIHFGVDRDEADAFGPNGAVGGNSADLLGAGVLIPQGTLVPGGATFSATLSDGTSLYGTFTNNIGHGYSPLDGFGFVNAQAAVQAVQKAVAPKQ